MRRTQEDAHASAEYRVASRSLFLLSFCGSCEPRVDSSYKRTAKRRTSMFNASTSQISQSASWLSAPMSFHTAPPGPFTSTEGYPRRQAAAATEQQSAPSLFPFQSNRTNTFLSQHSTGAPAAVSVPREIASSTDPLAVIARQKARYARGYIPPVALRYSQLSPAADTQTEKLQGERLAAPQPATSTQRPTAAAPSPPPPQQQQQQHTWKSVQQPPMGSAVPPASMEWRSLLLSLHEQQMTCCRQLSAELLVLHGDVRCMREELRGIKSGSAAAPVIAEQPPPSSGQRRRAREQKDDDGSCAIPKLAAGAAAHRMAVHSVRLIGASSASTPAFLNDTCSCEEKEDDADSPVVIAAPVAGGAVSGDSVSDRADSEADLFLL